MPKEGSMGLLFKPPVRLIPHSGFPTVTNIRNPLGTSRLVYLRMDWITDVVRLLLDHGADVHIQGGRFGSA